MNTEAYTENPENVQAKILNLFQNSVSESTFNLWKDTFEIDLEPGGAVTVYYHGPLSVKKFKKECNRALWVSICSVVGYRKKIDVKCGEKKERPAKEFQVAPKKKKNRIKALRFLVAGMFFACVALGIGVVTCSYLINQNFRETFYTVSSMKVNNSVRVIQLSDLHSRYYGVNNEKLIDRIKKLKPDIIICTGDMVDIDDAGAFGIENLGKALSEVAPLYFVYGNNEKERVYDFYFNEADLDEKFGFTAENRDENALPEAEDPFEAFLEDAGFIVLKNEKATVQVDRTTVDVYGVLNSNPSSFWSYSGNRFQSYLEGEESNLKITAVHEPFIFEEFESDFWGDLMLCGHTHGGLCRVPLIGPLYTKEGGLFPERNDCYVYGRYDVAGRPLIVSSGLVNTEMLRINNQPELVIIDINKF